MTSHRNASGANAPCRKLPDLVDGQMPELVPSDAEFDVAVSEPEPDESQTETEPHAPVEIFQALTQRFAFEREQCQASLSVSSLGSGIRGRVEALGSRCS